LAVASTEPGSPASDAPVDITIGVVSYNVRPLLERCLHSAEASLAEIGGGTLVVIDNASHDGSVDLVRERFPNVHLIASTENLGFGAGCNLALAQASVGGAILWLNPDAELMPGALPALLAALDADPSVALVGPLVTYPDGRPQPTRRRFPTRRDLAIEGTPLEWRGVARSLLNRYYCLDRSEEAGPVDWLSGACLLGRVDALRRLGGFSANFFMYFEEVDLAKRLAAYGWTIWYEPGARVAHHHSQSADQNIAAKERHYYGSKYRYASRYFGRTAAKALRLWSAGLFAAELAVQRARGDAMLVRRYDALVRWHLRDVA